MEASPLRTHRTLADLAVGESGVVARVDLAGALSVRLQEMGFVANTSVRLIRRAPLGDPLQIEVRGYQVSVRRNEASLIHLVSPGGTR